MNKKELKHHTNALFFYYLLTSYSKNRGSGHGHLEQLKKVYDDPEYLEYLVFKRNHELKGGSHARLEMTDPENYYSPKLIRNILFRLLNGLNGRTENKREISILLIIKRGVFCIYFVD